MRLQLFEGTPPVILYLPADLSPERKFPVIVELPGNGNFKNAFGDLCFIGKFGKNQEIEVVMDMYLSSRNHPSQTYGDQGEIRSSYVGRVSLAGVSRFAFDKHIALYVWQSPCSSPGAPSHQAEPVLQSA